MKELEILISVLERDLEIISKLPQIVSKAYPLSLQEQKKHEIEICKQALEILDSYRSQLIEGCLI